MKDKRTLTLLEKVSNSIMTDGDKIKIYFYYMKYYKRKCGIDRVIKIKFHYWYGFKMNSTAYEDLDQNKNKSKTGVKLFCMNCPYTIVMKSIKPYRENFRCPHCGNLLVVDN